MRYLTHIKLTGNLEQFGADWLLEVANPAEAIYAICVNCPAFEKYLHESEEQYAIVIGDRPIASEDDLGYGHGGATITLIPVVQGSGLFGGLFKIFAGVALTLFSGGTLATFGLSLALGGLTSFFQGRKGTKQETKQPGKSFLIDAQQTGYAGEVVPVLYGERMISDLVPISSALTHQNFTEGDDSLSSSIARTLYIVSEGEIEGSSNLRADIHLDDTPISTLDPNNTRITTPILRNGTAGQAAIPGFETATNTITIKRRVKNSTSGNDCTIQGWDVAAVNNAVSYQIADSAATSCTIGMFFKLLRVEAQNVGTSPYEIWFCYFRIKITDAASTAIYSAVWREDAETRDGYEKAFGPFALTGTAPWTVTISKLSPDPANHIEGTCKTGNPYAQPGTPSNTAEVYDEIQWQYLSYSVPNPGGGALTYPNTAVLAVYVPSTEFQNPPNVSFNCKGMKVKVWHNYTPSTRSYSGVFNGTLTATRFYTNNPVLCLLDMLITSRYGLAEYITTADIDLYSFYSLSQWCDELVGGKPRFTLNAYLQDAGSAFDILNAIASVFWGATYFSQGVITAIADRPSALIKHIFTPANVIQDVDGDGRVTRDCFQYSGTALDTRYSVALVNFADPTNQYRNKTIKVEVAGAIARYGRRVKEVTAFGCADEDEAIRLGRWHIWTSYKETEALAFRAGIEGLLLRPGDLVSVADPSLLEMRRGGRVVAATTTQVNIDDEVILSGGFSYSLYCFNASDQVMVRTVTTAPSTTSVLTVSPAFSSVPVARSTWILDVSGGVSVANEVYRILSIGEGEDGFNYEISAIRHYALKYAEIDA